MSAAVQAEAFFPLDRVPLVTLARAKKRGLSMDSAHSVGGGLDQSRIPEAGHCMMIFLGLLSALNPAPFNGQHSS